jgi:hypothetical protein
MSIKSLDFLAQSQLVDSACSRPCCLVHKTFHPQFCPLGDIIHDCHPAVVSIDLQYPKTGVQIPLRTASAAKASGFLLGSSSNASGRPPLKQREKMF